MATRLTSQPLLPHAHTHTHTVCMARIHIHILCVLPGCWSHASSSSARCHPCTLPRFPLLALSAVFVSFAPSSRFPMRGRPELLSWRGKGTYGVKRQWGGIQPNLQPVSWDIQPYFCCFLRLAVGNHFTHTFGSSTFSYSSSTPLTPLHRPSLRYFSFLSLHRYSVPRRTGRGRQRSHSGISPKQGVLLCSVKFSCIKIYIRTCFFRLQLMCLLNSLFDRWVCFCQREAFAASKI